MGKYCYVQTLKVQILIIHPNIVFLGRKK